MQIGTLKPATRWLLLTALLLFVQPVGAQPLAQAQDVTVPQDAVPPDGAVPVAQEVGTGAAAETDTPTGITTLPPLQPADTSSFRATIASFLAACNELDALAETDQDGDNFRDRILPAAERIKDCLDLSDLPLELRDTVGVESGVYLKEVLDRIELPAQDAIPDSSDEQTSALTHWRIPGTRITLARVTEGTDAGAFVFTADTVRRAAKLYSVAAQLPYRSDGPPTSPGFYARYQELTKRQPTLTADTASPRGTFTLFLSKTNETYEWLRSQDFANRSDPTIRPLVMQILRCMDLSELPEYSREDYAIEAAVCLKEILDRAPLPHPEQIPGPEDVKSIGGGEPLASWQIPNTKLTISRIADGPQRGEYLLSSKTVQNAVDLYNEIKAQPYRTSGQPISAGLHDWFLSSPGNPLVAAWIQRLPAFFTRRPFGLALWQWLGLIVGTCVAITLMILAYRIGGIRSEVTREISLFRYWASLLFAIIAMLVPLGFKQFVWKYLTIRGTALYVVEFLSNLVFLGALIIVLLAIGSRLADSIAALPKAKSHRVDPTLIRILFRLISIIAAAIVFLEGGRYLGFPITTLLASAGIGGLAIAFAAQGMIRGLFGTVTILLDRPFHVGDRIIAKGQDGIVEEIGLRSTKIREFQTGHLISIPNDQMADAEIENIGRRSHICRLSDLHIPIDTSREKLEKAIETIRQVLENHEGMDPENPPRVYFNEFNPDSFNIRVIYWYSPPDLWKFYEMSEQVNLEIFRVFEQHGIQFSLPVRHSFWKHDDQQGPLDVRVLDDRGETVAPPRDAS